MKRVSAVVVVLSLACPCLAQQTQQSNADAEGAAQGNQGVESGEIQTTEITGEGVRTGGLAENGGLQSAFGPSEANAFFTAISSASGQGGRGNTRQFSVFGNGGTGTTRAGGSSSTTRQVRPRFRLGFVPSKSLNAAGIQSRTSARLGKLARRVGSIKGVSVTADAKGVVTLTGTVDTPNARRLASNLLRMEPGVRSVRNQLQVAATPTAPAGG